MKYEEAVAEARRLAKRSDEDQWTLARLTWEQLEAGATVRRWADDIGVSARHVQDLNKLWARFGSLYAAAHKDQQPGFWEAMYAARNNGLDVADAQQRERDLRAGRQMQLASPQKRVEVARALMADPDVAEQAIRDPQVERTVGQAYSRARYVPTAELRAAAERVPEEIRNESLGSPTGVSQYLAEIRVYLRLIHELAESPRVNWEGFRGPVAEELRRIARQAEGLAEIIEDPTKGRATDEALEQLLREAR